IAEHVGHFVLINYYGFAGLSLYLIIVTAVMSLDPLASDSLGKNVQILRANGFADGYVLAAMVVNMVSSQTLTLIVINWICGQDAMASLWSSHIYTLQLLGRIIVNLVGTELLFYVAHKFLHETWPDIHVMHHCCKYPSWTTNLIFHPFDLAFEFGGPGAILLLFHYFVWDQDKPVLLLSYMFVQTYYAIDHDEWTRTYHYEHHSKLDSVYTIYIQKRDDAKLNRIKKMIKR
ncbi:hypothetical protein HDU99_010823, partial [Rhizoclosmatium hyalinum]